MLRLSIEDFTEEIKAEMGGYEEISEKHMEDWLKTFRLFIAAKKKSSILIYKNKCAEVKLKDESDLFMIVDRFLVAIINDDLDKYYGDWSL